MRFSVRDQTIVALTVAVQFMLEVTLGRVLAAPNILVPVLVYLALNREPRWHVQGKAFFSGLSLDLLTHQPPGTSSLSMILGILAARRLLSATIAAGEVSFYLHSVLASIFSDLLFILLASRPPGAYFGIGTLLVIPRAVAPLACLAVVQILLFRIRSDSA